jgi:hypothetical protein
LTISKFKLIAYNFILGKEKKTLSISLKFQNLSLFGELIAYLYYLKIYFGELIAYLYYLKIYFDKLIQLAYNLLFFILIPPSPLLSDTRKTLVRHVSDSSDRFPKKSFFFYSDTP